MSNSTQTVPLVEKEGTQISGELITSRRNRPIYTGSSLLGNPACKQPQGQD